MSDQGNSNTMFSNNGSDQTADTQQTTTDQVPEFLKAFVGEGKKYSNLEAALQSIPAAQAHIEKLEGEAAHSRLTEEQQDEKNKQLLADLERKLMEKMQQQATPAPSAPPATPPSDDQSDGVDLEQVVLSTVQKIEAQKSAKDNQMSVIQSAITQWGDKAETTLYSRAADLGMTPQEIDQLAATRPSAAMKLLDMKSDTQNTSGGMNFNSTLNTQSGGNLGDVPMPGMPDSYDMWGDDNYLAQHIRDIEKHMKSTGELVD